MSSVNKAFIVGRLGSDPEVRFTQGGNAVANFRVATSEKFKGKDGVQKEKTEWHRIVVWGKQAEFCGEYLSKGRQVCIVGSIETSKWEDRNGNEKYTTEIRAHRVTFLGGEQSSDGRSQERTEPLPLDDADIPF